MVLVLVDTNLLLLLIVARTDRSYLESHKRTQDYDLRDVDAIEQRVACYDGIVTTPHILSETSNLLRQIRNSARDRIQHTLRNFVLMSDEQTIASSDACRHDAYLELGLFDSVILVLCDRAKRDGSTMKIELLTADEPIYNRADALGLPAELYA